MTHAGLPSTVFWLMLLLGAYHGLNPGMGWLFAVALGMQEQKGSAVARSLVPIAVGHAFLGMTLPLVVIRYFVAAVLVGLGVYCLLRHRISPTANPLVGMLATGVHTVAYLAVTGLLAWVVYRKLGLALLRKAWFNFDLVWAVALVAAGLVTLLI